jgi:hypothetical protein
MSTYSDEEIVTQVINEWDPLNLFPNAPPNEYHGEITQVVKKLETEHEVGTLAQGIKEIFDHSFEGVYSCGVNEVFTIAKKILQKRNTNL